MPGRNWDNRAPNYAQLPNHEAAWIIAVLLALSFLMGFAPVPPGSPCVQVAAFLPNPDCGIGLVPGYLVEQRRRDAHPCEDLIVAPARRLRPATRLCAAPLDDPPGAVSD